MERRAPVEPLAGACGRSGQGRAQAPPVIRPESCNYGERNIEETPWAFPFQPPLPRLVWFRKEDGRFGLPLQLLNPRKSLTRYPAAGPLLAYPSALQESHPSSPGPDLNELPTRRPGRPSGRPASPPRRPFPPRRTAYPLPSPLSAPSGVSPPATPDDAPQVERIVACPALHPSPPPAAQVSPGAGPGQYPSPCPPNTSPKAQPSMSAFSSAGRTAAPARTRPRAQPLGNPFWGQAAILPRLFLPSPNAAGGSPCPWPCRLLTMAPKALAAGLAA